MDDLLREFLTETGESLDVVDVEVVKLEQDPNNRQVLSNIFRLVHTVKGTCGFLGLPRLEALAHAAENLFGMFRDGTLAVTPNSVTVILESLDRIKQILGVLETTEREPEGDDAALIARLDAIATAALAPIPATPSPATPSPAPPSPVTREPPMMPQRALKPGEVSLEALEAAFRAAPGPADLAAGAAPLLSDDEAAATAAHIPTEGPALPPARPATRPAAASAPAPAAAEAADTRPEGGVGTQSLRVSVDLLESLMTMVSELVLTRNQLLQMVRRQGESEFAVPLQRLSHVTSELQESVMKTRMQPIGNAWAKLPRVVRDLAHELGKKIELDMRGAETELDRQVLELIKDPLTHMVRNSADHGLERPEERRQAGKAETGRITLAAHHEGGHIIIQIRDDGRGLNLARIREKVAAKGLASEAELDAMSETQLARFIFHPGLSTAEAVTNVSGRGVGMDVVKTNIEKIGGTIELKTATGVGTTVQIKIPLTLAIVSALIVECAGEKFAVPQIGVVELVRASARSEHRIETINRTPVLRLRNRLLPLIHLAETMDLIPPGAARPDEVFVIVSQVGNQNFGIVVDRVFDTEEIVVKPVATILRDNSLFSGNTILGDGTVIMILDPNGLAERTGQGATEAAEATGAAAAAAVHDDRTAMLLFRAGGREPKAVPLALIARLEELEVDRLEQAHGRTVVQYRDRLMPVVTVTPDYQMATAGRQPVLVFADGDRAMGLAVDAIVDIVEDRLDVQLKASRPGLIGSAVIAGKATEIIDVAHYLTLAFEDWFKPANAERAGARRLGPEILLVDDSPFFRNMIVPVLTVAGYNVATAEDAAAALRLRDQGRGFDLIVSDIEMPGMDGFEFAEACHAQGRWRETPIIALSARTTEEDFEHGRAVGFADYVAKNDRDSLLASLRQVLARRHAA